MIVPLILSTFGIIFVAELPDKTALASLVLATRYPARHVVAGAWLAFMLQTGIAVVAGSLLQLLPARPVRVAAGMGFLIFAVLAVRRNEETELRREEQEVAWIGSYRPRPWLASFLVVFAAEWGDLTQLATAALVAHTGEPLSVAVGAVAALWVVTVLAAFAGSQMSRFLTPMLLTRVSAVLFLTVGLFIIASALVAP